MAGTNIQMAARGIKELVDGKYTLTTIDREESKVTPLLIRQKTTEGTRHYYLYKVGFIRKDMMKHWKGKYFVFFTSIIDSGIWADLTPRAKALYLIMREVARFDPELYTLIEYDGQFELEGAEASDFYNTDQYRKRKWDICEMSLAEISRIVGIASSNIQQVLNQLEYYRLVERMDNCFKVYLRPRIRENPYMENPKHINNIILPH
jgi:hypothetical protein